MSLKEHFEVSDAMPLMPFPQEQKNKIWFRLLPNIDLGHMLTMIGFAAALVVQWNSIDRRLTILEEQARLNTSNASDKIQEIKSDVRQIKDAVGQMQTALAVQAARTEQRK